MQLAEALWELKTSALASRYAFTTQCLQFVNTDVVIQFGTRLLTRTCAELKCLEPKLLPSDTKTFLMLSVWPVLLLMLDVCQLDVIVISESDFHCVDFAKLFRACLNKPGERLASLSFTVKEMCLVDISKFCVFLCVFVLAAAFAKEICFFKLK